MKQNYAWALLILKGIKEQTVKWNDQLLTMERGLPESSIAQQGISAPLVT